MLIKDHQYTKAQLQAALMIAFGVGSIVMLTHIF